MTNLQKRVVVIGAGYAGLLATMRLAGKMRGRKVSITLVNASDAFVERVRLHQYAANQPTETRDVDHVRAGKTNLIEILDTDDTENTDFGFLCHL